MKKVVVIDLRHLVGVVQVMKKIIELLDAFFKKDKQDEKSGGGIQ